MYRGTTPTLNFTLPIDSAEIDKCKIVFAQYKDLVTDQLVVVLEKDFTDCVLDGTTAKLTLTEEETLKFQCGQKAFVQFFPQVGECKMASDWVEIDVKTILKEGCYA